MIKIKEQTTINSPLLILINNCKNIVKTINKKEIAKGLANFYEKKLDYLECEIIADLKEDKITPLKEIQYQNQLASIRIELKYIYDASYNLEEIDEAKKYFNDEESLFSKEVDDIITQLNKKKKLPKDYDISKFRDGKDNNLLHILMLKGNDVAIVNLLKVKDKKKKKIIYSLLSSVNKEGNSPFCFLIINRRFLVVEAIEKLSDKTYKQLIFSSQLKGLIKMNNEDDFEFLYQALLSKISEVKLFELNYNPLIFLASTLNNNEVISKYKVTIEDLMILIASYRNKKDLIQDFETIKEKFSEYDFSYVFKSINFSRNKM